MKTQDEKAKLLADAMKGEKVDGRDPVLLALNGGVDIRELEGRSILNTAGVKVPVLQYAIDNDIKIDGIDPLKYAVEHKKWFGPHSDISAMEYGRQQGKTIDGVDPVKYALDNGLLVLQGESAMEYSIRKNIEIDGKSAMQYAIDNGIRIHKGLYDPIEYAMINDIQINSKSALQYAIDAGIKIDGQDPLKYLVEHNWMFKGKPIALYARENGMKIDGEDPLKYAVDKELPCGVNRYNAIKYAIDNNIKIDGKPAIQYGVDKNLDYDGLKSVIGHGLYSGKDLINGVSPIAYILDNDKEVKGKKGAELAVEIGVKYLKGYDLKPKLGYELVEAYINATEVGKQNIAGVHESIRQKDSDLDESFSKLFSDGNIKTVARKIERLAAQGKLDADISPDALVCNLKMETLSNICKVSATLDSRKEEHSTARDLLDKFCNKMKQIVGKGVRDKDVISGIKSFAEKHAPKETGGTFAEKYAKSGQRQSGNLEKFSERVSKADDSSKER